MNRLYEDNFLFQIAIYIYRSKLNIILKWLDIQHTI
jgi:hypothetical protein